MSIFNFFRSKKSKKKYPVGYSVTVHVDHLNVPGHIRSFMVTIDATDKAHALNRLRKELQFKFDRPRKL